MADEGFRNFLKNKIEKTKTGHLILGAHKVCRLGFKEGGGGTARMNKSLPASEQVRTPKKYKLL